MSSMWHGRAAQHVLAAEARRGRDERPRAAITRLDRALPFLFALLLVIATPAAALHPHNRDLERIAVWPESTGVGHVISAIWTCSAQPAPVLRNLSTDVVLEISGEPPETCRVEILVHPGTGSCSQGPPCSGLCCSATIDGQEVPFRCYRDGPCTAESCDCDCGRWITTEFVVHALVPGDVVSIVLLPAPGALPDADEDDDQRSTPYHGRPVGWDRGLAGLTLFDVGQGFFEVHVDGRTAWESQPGYGNLDFQLELMRNGVLLDLIKIPAEIEESQDQTCLHEGCESACGTYNGVSRTCGWHVAWECACQAGWFVLFPPVQLNTGDEVEVRLTALPDALPQVRRPNDNDVIIIFCCAPSSLPARLTPIEEASALSPANRLEQSRPNPWRSPDAPTSIAFELAEPGRARLEVFDVGGRLVRTLLDRSFSAGRWAATWDGTDAEGRNVPPGVYFYRLTTTDGAVSRSLVTGR